MRPSSAGRRRARAAAAPCPRPPSALHPESPGALQLSARVPPRSDRFTHPSTDHWANLNVICHHSNQPASPKALIPSRPRGHCPNPLDKVIRPSAIKLPQTPFARFRLLFLVFAVASAVMAAARHPHGRRPSPRAKLGRLCSRSPSPRYWIFGYRRGRFSLALELFEAYAVFLILHVAPGDPFLPLLGLIFRSLYGGSACAFARYVAVDGRAARRPRRPRRRAAAGRPRPRRRRRARPGARPGAARRA